MKTSSFDQINKPHISQGRRKLVTGLLGATAFTTLAPQQWTQPVINRIVAPAHGQAVSIAAGRYQGEVEQPTNIPNCGVFSIIEFDWEGGVEQNNVLIRIFRIEARGNATGCNFLDTDPKPQLLPIVVRPSGSPPAGVNLEVINTSPSLPSGFSFFIIF